MKKLFLFLSIFALFCSCKRTVSCSQNVYSIPAYTGFAGFAPADLQTVKLMKFAPNNKFVNPLDSQTAHPNLFTVSGDTILTDDNALILVRGYQYELVLEAVHRAFRLGKLTYNGDSVIYYTRQSDCGTLDNAIREASAAIVDNRTDSTLKYGVNHRYVIFRR